MYNIIQDVCKSNEGWEDLLQKICSKGDRAFIQGVHLVSAHLKRN